MNTIARIHVATAQDTACAHALMVETTAAWLAAKLQDPAQTDVRTINRLQDSGLGHLTHTDGEYHVSIAGMHGTGPTIRDALTDWIDTRNAKETG
jgi:hypothetical protein